MLPQRLGILQPVLYRLERGFEGGELVAGLSDEGGQIGGEGRLGKVMR